MPELPHGVASCGQTPPITKENMPKELPPLPAGVWGKVVAKAGLMKYTLLDDQGSVKSCVWMKAGAPVTIEPQTKYSLQMMGADACFTIEFFSKKPEADAASLPKSLMNPRPPTSPVTVGLVAAAVVAAAAVGYYYIKSRK
uniref:TehB/YeaR-like domain-containing protein n=1 Tax=Hemiselmis andersenii TaxID=464988 RepID=A0A6U4NAV5_HEMAN